MVTMLLGGLWHGAAWTFVIWGGLHGVFIMINHAWRAWNGPRLHPLLALCLTSISVEVAWAFFRAPGLHSAIGVLSSMAGLHGIVPDRMTPILGDLNRIGSVLLLVPVVWLAPNSQEIVGIVKSG